MRLNVPQHLVDELRAGRVIAFVGAGFSAAARMPTWIDLIKGICASALAVHLITDSQTAFVHKIVKRGTGSDLDQAMQYLQDLLGIQFIADELNRVLKPHDPMPDEMYRRLCLIRSLPFRAILTTNFDDLLPGVVASDVVNRPFEEVLRGRHQGALASAPIDYSPCPSPSVACGDMPFPSSSVASVASAPFASPASNVKTTGGPVPAAEASIGPDDSFTWDLCFDDRIRYDTCTAASNGLRQASVPVIQLHGSVRDAGSLVATRQGYRTLLNLIPGYSTFLRSVMSVYTVLYIGFSFSDQYLNQLRSEILSVLRPQDSHGLPVAYAIVMDKEQGDSDFFRIHEGVHFLNWDTNGQTDFSGIERYLWILRNRINPWINLGAMLHRRRILCIDPAYDSDYGLGDLVPAMYHAVFLYEREDDDEIWQESSQKIVELSTRQRGNEYESLKLYMQQEHRLRRMERSPSPDVAESAGAEGLLQPVDGDGDGDGDGDKTGSPDPFSRPHFERRVETKSLVVHRALSLEACLEALRAVGKDQPPYDVIITNYGFQQGRDRRRPFVADLLQALHSDEELIDKRAPVVVYSHRIDLADRKREVLRYGAIAYACSEKGLFHTLHHIFSPAK